MRPRSVALRLVTFCLAALRSLVVFRLQHRQWIQSRDFSRAIRDFFHVIGDFIRAHRDVIYDIECSVRVA